MKRESDKAAASSVSKGVTVTPTNHLSVSKETASSSVGKGVSVSKETASSSVSINAPEGFYVTPTNHSSAVKFVLFSRACLRREVLSQAFLQVMGGLSVSIHN